MRIELEQGSPEWLEWRKNGIGGSDICAIMGVSPWKTIDRLYEEKLGEESTFVSNAMKKGKKYEKEALFSYEKATKGWCQPCCFQDDEIDYLRGSLDGISIDEKTITELKVPGEATLKLAEMGQISTNYLYQCQWYLMLSKAEICHFYAYCTDKKEGHLVEVLPDHELWKEMRIKAAEFWNRVKLQIPYEKKRVELPIIEDENFLKKELELRHIRQTLEGMKEIEKLEDKLEKDLIQMANRSSCKGKYFQILKTEAKGFVDYSAIPELRNVDLDAYRKKSIEKFQIKSL